MMLWIYKKVLNLDLGVGVGAGKVLRRINILAAEE